MKIKNLFIFFFLFGMNTQSHAQFKTKNYNTEHSKFYLGLGTGINASSGYLGLKANIELNPKVMLDLGLGFSTWNYKQTLNVLYITKPENGWCPGIGFSRGSGVDTITILTEVRNNKSNIINTRSTKVQLKNMYALNLMVQKQWYTKSKNRLALDLGLAFQMKGLVKDPVTSKESDFTVTEKGQALTLLLAPGGLIAGFSYNFKL